MNEYELEGCCEVLGVITLIVGVIFYLIALFVYTKITIVVSLSILAILWTIYFCYYSLNKQEK